jgi:hypothetical protein
LTKAEGGRKGRRMNKTVMNSSFVICQLFYMSFARGRDAQRGRKLRRNSNRDVKLSFVILVINHLNREKIWQTELMLGVCVVHMV